VEEKKKNADLSLKRKKVNVHELIESGQKPEAVRDLSFGRMAGGIIECYFFPIKVPPPRGKVWTRPKSAVSLTQTVIPAGRKEACLTDRITSAKVESAWAEPPAGKKKGERRGGRETNAYFPPKSFKKRSKKSRNTVEPEKRKTHMRPKLYVSGSRACLVKSEE